jgi:hypothetical protein
VQNEDLLDNVAKSAIGFVYTIARAALRRGVAAVSATVNPTSRAGPIKPVRDGGRNGRAVHGTPIAQP